MTCQGATGLFVEARQLLQRALHFIAVTHQPAIFCGDSPTRLAIFQQLLNALLLQLSVDRQMQFDHPDTVANQHRFELADPLDGARLATPRFLRIVQGRTKVVLVPAVEIDRQVAARRQRIPESPQRRIRMR